MNCNTLEKHFVRMGARVDVHTHSPRFAVDVLRDRRNARFDIALDNEVQHVCALDVQPRSRHLLLVVQRGGTHKYLCGHDERDWFAAAVPDAGVASVRAAMESLKPLAVRTAVSVSGVRLRHRNRRRNAAFIRQGEWFFVPRPNLKVDPLGVIHNEPLSRGRGKSHWVECVYRSGGAPVYFTDQPLMQGKYRNGLSEQLYRRLLLRNPQAREWRWRILRQNPDVFARGKVRHPDHKTIFLDGWHRVFMNTENQAPAMQHLIFFD